MPFTRAAIVSTGTEILQGLYADMNARYLAEKLSKLGIRVVMSGAAPDDAGELESLLHHSASRADIVICSGGLGPTADDVNREVFAKVFHTRLVRDEHAVEMMRERFRTRGRQMPDSNLVQALVPLQAQVFPNEWGTAPGFYLPPAAEREAPGGSPPAALIAVPGPPRELIPMFEKYAIPILRQHAGGKTFVCTRTIHTFGRPESDLAECVHDLFFRDPRVTYTMLAKSYGVDVRITPHASTPGEMEAILREFEVLTRERIGDTDIYGIDEDTMQGTVAALLREKGISLCTAESCTGGLVTKLLTDVPGSSAFMLEGFVTYSNAAKQKSLGVRPETLLHHGAVSAETAIEMASGARTASGADIAVSVTGIAGPEGGTLGKPVGLTYIGLACAEGVRWTRNVFPGDRDTNRLLAALSALNLLRLYLLGGIRVNPQE